MFLQFTDLIAVDSAVNRPSLSSEARAAYLRALSELLDPEIDLLLQLMADRKVHPIGIKTLLAGDMTAAVHGIDQAEASRAGFSAQFSTKRFSDTLDLPVITPALASAQDTAASPRAALLPLARWETQNAVHVLQLGAA